MTSPEHARETVVSGQFDLSWTEQQAENDRRFDELAERVNELTLAFMARDEYRDDLVADTVKRVDAFERQLAEIAERPEAATLAAVLAELRSIRVSAAAFYSTGGSPVHIEPHR